MSDLADMLATIEDIRAREAVKRIERESLAAANRERMRQWSPEFYGLCEQLKAEGMFGRVMQFEVNA